MRTRSAFSLVELLVATVIIVVLLALTFTIWRGTQQAVERARTVIQLDLRTRDIANKALFALDNRSGVLPMALQNEAYGSQWPYRIYTFMANAERGSGSVTTVAKESVADPQFPGVTRVKKWIREETDPMGEFLFWRVPPPPNTEPARDSYAPGMQLLSGSETGDGWRWAPAPMAMWHGTVVPVDAGKRYITGNTSRIVRALIHTTQSQNNNTYSWPGDPRQNGSIPDPRSMQPYAPGMLYRGGFSTVGGVSSPSIYGPYRGVMATPWLIHADPSPIDVSWLGETHALRVVNGPGFFGEPVGRNAPAWVPLRTGIYGPNEDGMLRRGPDWYQGSLLNPTPTGPRPMYGSRIVDESVIWRVEAPYVYAFGPAGGSARLTRVLVESGSVVNFDITNPNRLGNINRWYMGALTPHTIMSAGINHRSGGRNNNFWTFNPDATTLAPSDSVMAIQAYPFRPNISEFRVRTGKTGSPAGLPQAARGRFGSLVAGVRAVAGTNANPAVVPWTDNADPDGNDREVWSMNALSFIGRGETMPTNENTWRTNQIGQFHAAGFQGSVPSALTSPGHPSWVLISVGAIGGFSNQVDMDPLDRRPRDSAGVPEGPLLSPSVVERRWSLGTGLR